jgi:hypothetical protein
VELDIKGGRHYTASQLLAGGFDLRNTAARLGHSGGGATTLRHYADPVPEVDRRAAAYLAQLTAGSATQSGQSSRFARLASASSSRSQVAARATSAATRVAWNRPSVLVDWRPLLSVAIVSHFVTRSLANW